MAVRDFLVWVSEEVNKKCDETEDQVSKERAGSRGTGPRGSRHSAVAVWNALASRSDVRSGRRRLDCVVFTITGTGSDADTDTR